MNTEEILQGGKKLLGLLLHVDTDAEAGIQTKHYLAIDTSSPDGAGVQHVVTTTPIQEETGSSHELGAHVGTNVGAEVEA